MSVDNYTMGIDVGTGKDICVEDRYMKPTWENPEGSWLHLVDGKVQIATGYYSTLYPDKPSPYWHGGAPFILFETVDAPWERKNDKDNQA